MGCKASKCPHSPHPKGVLAADISPKAEFVIRSACRFGSQCPQRHSASHINSFSHPGDHDFIPRAPCRFGEECNERLREDHCSRCSHPGDEDYYGPRKACRYAGECRDSDARHLRRFSHPGDPDDHRPAPRKACKFGLRCFRRCDEHLAEFVHPGDRDYRRGRVTFEDGAEPEFETLRQLFDFCDPLEHGNFAGKEDLRSALHLLARYREGGALDADRVWVGLEGASGGGGFVGFAMFAAWATRVGVFLPVGVDVAPDQSERNNLSCGFVFPDGSRCDCKHFCADEGAATAHLEPEIKRTPSKLLFCKCGHKRSMHAERESGGRSARSSMAPVPHYWPDDPGQPFLDQAGVARFQRLFDRTHKTSENWTRDRGCALHGTKCSATDPMCAFRNKADVPIGYRVVGVMRNMNHHLWGYYAVNRGAVMKECETDLGQPFRAINSVETSGVSLEDTMLADSCNEWLLFHGTSPGKCESICQNNFRISLAGTGATWKDKGSQKGTPLYGHGVYFADRITKADEYSEMVEAGRRFAGCHTVLVSRVLGGRVQYCDTNEIDPAALQKQVIAGPFHSVFGDRVTKLKKPFREVVVYDATQCYPEYLVYYRRLYN